MDLVRLTFYTAPVSLLCLAPFALALEASCSLFAGVFGWRPVRDQQALVASLHVLPSPTPALPTPPLCAAARQASAVPSWPPGRGCRHHCHNFPECAGVQLGELACSLLSLACVTRA